MSRLLKDAPQDTEILIWIPSTKLWWPGYKNGKHSFSNAHGRLNARERWSPRARFWIPMPPPPSED